jgi:hypothetical protein
MPGLRAFWLRPALGAQAAPSTRIVAQQDPIRAELFSAERLEQLAESLARQRTLAEGETGRPWRRACRTAAASWSSLTARSPR